MFGLPKKKQTTSKADEINIIIGALERFVSHLEKNDWDDNSKYDWDDHMSIQFEDKKAEAVRQLCHQVSDAFHGKGMTTYSPEGINILKAILEALKKERL